MSIQLQRQTVVPLNWTDPNALNFQPWNRLHPPPTPYNEQTELPPFGKTVPISLPIWRRPSVRQFRTVLLKNILKSKNWRWPPWPNNLPEKWEVCEFQQRSGDHSWWLCFLNREYVYPYWRPNESAKPDSGWECESRYNPKLSVQNVSWFIIYHF